MLTTIFFAFLSGIITVASPCVLPVLPFLLSGSIGGKARPYGIIAGFVVSFTLATLFIGVVVQALGIAPDMLRTVSVGMLLVFGLLLAVPFLHQFYERLSSRAVAGIQGSIQGSTQSSGVKTENNGFIGGLSVGLTLGLLWTPCVGPIMASVITLALSGAVTAQAIATTVAFSLGTALPMLAVMLGGRKLLGRIPALMQNLGRVQQGFGVVLVVFAIGIGFGYDRAFQSWFLDTFPGYSDALTKLEQQVK
jgi:cytochrome c-type biogenesis protein